MFKPYLYQKVKKVDPSNMQVNIRIGYALQVIKNNNYCLLTTLQKGNNVKKILSILVISSVAGITHAAPLETFEVTATLNSATGPTPPPPGEPGLFCREEQQPIGVAENFGQFTVDYDSTTGEAQFIEGGGGSVFSSTQASATIDDDRTFLAFSAQLSETDFPQPGFSSQVVETVNLTYADYRRPALRGTLTDVRTTTELETGDTAECTFTYSLSGGVGRVNDALTVEQEVGIIDRVISTVREALTIDETESRNFERVSSSIGVRG